MKDQKHPHALTINLTDEQMQLIKALANYYERKPAELVRLLLSPVLLNEWAKVQTIEHPENRQPLQRV